MDSSKNLISGKNIKNVFKDKKFLVVFGIVVLLGGIVLYIKMKNTTDTTDTTDTNESYGNGTDSGTLYTPITFTQQSDIEDEKEVEDNGINDEIDLTHQDSIDQNQKLQEVSNKIRDYKDLWTRTNEEFGEVKTNEEQKILDDIHQKAVQTASSVGLSDTSKDSSGNYVGMLSDTRTYNSITGQAITTQSGITSQLVDSVKTSRIEAQKQITELQNQYTLAKTQTEKNAIHQKAEEIGIMAGLGSGGTTGSSRATVNLNTGDLKKPVNKSAQVEPPKIKKVK